MSSSTFAGNSDGTMTGVCSAPPPPPPPPPVPGQLPAMRIKSAEAPAAKRAQIVRNEGYEPPAAIQNAMLTKDKKPFTYTPGMGGKLDLSQIRSPRMARRVAKNANDEGIEGPPKSALEPKPTPTQTSPNLFIQPQVAVPVFPTNIPVQSPVNRTPPTPQTPPTNRFAANGNVPEKVAEPVKIACKVEPRIITPVTPGTPNTPESPNTPTQVTLAKAPTPWMQNKIKPQEELPEWAKRSAASKQSSGSPESPSSPPVYTTQLQQVPQSQWQPSQQKQQASPPRQQMGSFTVPPVIQQVGPQNQQERMIPVRIEDRPSVFDVKHDTGHHQFKQSASPHHQQRWGQAPAQNQVQAQQPTTPIVVQPQQSSGGGYIIPIMVEGNEKRASSGAGSNSQLPVRNSMHENQNARVVQQRAPIPVQPGEPGPVQSRSFRVLQKITDTDVANDVDGDQLRKLQLTDDDRLLMNKFKEQVDSDSFLHHEEDPRYRGAAIPSRAFRFLQTMTDGGEMPVASTAPRVQNSAINKKQNRNSKSFEESQANLPPSEQQVQEPKKYMGSAIPSRSFRILQAMTAPESVATQDNRQADYTCQTENNLPGNQQGVFYHPPCPPAALWNPEGAWWGYYPLPYPPTATPSPAPNDPSNPYPYHEGTAYIYYPIYSQNFPPSTPYPNVSGDKNPFPPVYPQYATPLASRNNQNNDNGYCQPPDNSRAQNQDIQDTVNANPAKLSNHTNNLNALPHWDKKDTISRTASSNSKDSDSTTAMMNITDEEEILEPVEPDRITRILPQTESIADKQPEGFNNNVPSYTYIDASDSSDSTDTESQSDNESIADSSKSSSISNNNAETDNTSSDSDDSDSYLAYSTGFNPHGRSDSEINGGANSFGQDKGSSSSDSKKMDSTDCHSNVKEDTSQQVDESNTEPPFPHKLSVIYEVTEQSESPKAQDARVWSETPFEATDDPPDEADTTTVSVSLPLRFKFSVSENNEDVTTVIVGDSTIKEERQSIKDETRTSKMEEIRTNEKVSDASNSYQVDSETSVDFTVKRQSEVKRKVRNFEKAWEEQSEKKVERSEDEEAPHVNFTLRKIPTRLGKMNFEETIETEYTIKSKRSTRKEDAKLEKEEQVNKERLVEVKEGTVGNTVKGTGRATGSNIGAGSESLANNINNATTTKADQNKFERHDFQKNVVKPEVVVSECVWEEDPNKTIDWNASGSNEQLTIDEEESPATANSDPSESTNQKINHDQNLESEEKGGKEPKHLLSVQNSREETDDEDSGVTSDMSRIISEVDTDSECTSTKNIRKYQRTQTHSRLFRLLNDDSMLPDSPQKSDESSSRREYLSLPLKSTAFNYDENYCSNYSSGLTSPEFSPICEQSWRGLHDSDVGSTVANPVDPHRQVHPALAAQDRLPCQEDPYYQAWKASKPTGNESGEHDALPSQAFKILETRRPLWSHKVNVLCPRIKSTKSVPHALQSSKSLKSSHPPTPISSRNVKSEHC